ncbi:hypothetical protein D1AOALGA4SA_11273 [Olavius algarvensis Delta 1 endosymbiont]|nr:hypothetical protein D1AOALGA4SA_11273 [Olavius algarvensis Delta 1 endosymbiont]
MATHMLYEAINHAHNRYLYGNRVTAMPHIRRGFLEAWSRILMSRLYCYRATDYFRQANKETDRRYILFNAIQKARAAAQNEAAVIIMHNIMAAKAYETNTFAETAVRNTGNAVRLEGTAHVNMGQAVKFMNNYFNDNVDLPEVPDGKMLKDDSSSMFDQGFGKVKNIKFNDYRKSFKGCELANVKIFLEQAASLKKFNNASPMSKGQMKNHDFMLNVAEIFGVVAYGQLVFEKARIENIDEMVVDQLFSYLVRDINRFVIRQVNEYAGHFADGQKENLLDIIKEPHIDFDREEHILVDYVFSLDGAYGSTYGEKINE